MEENKQVTAEEVIKRHLFFMGKTNDKWWLQASIKSYLEGGSVSGSLQEAIVKAMEEYATRKNLSVSEGLKKFLADTDAKVQQLTAENERLRKVFEELLGCYIELQNTPNISNATRSLWRKAAGINLTP